MLTVSIVLHKTSEALINSVVESLKREPVDRIYFVDNSPDDSLAQVIRRYEKVEYQHVPNKGYGNAHNIAIRQAIESGSDYHLVLNPDVRWNDNVLAELVGHLDTNQGIGLIQPRIVYPDGTLQHTCRLLPTPWDVFAKRFLPGFMIRKRMHRYMLDNSAYERPFNAVYMQGSFLFFRTSVFEKTGLFDERFFMYPEDIDITRRVRDAGYDAKYYPSLSIIHDHAAASSRWNRMLWIHITNMARYFNKWGWFFDSRRRTLNRELRAELGS